MTARDSATARPAGLSAAWAVVLGMGATSITYNVYHAVHHGWLALPLALLFGIAPVFAAACLSHVVAVHQSGTVEKVILYVVTVGAMVMSIRAIAAVVEPVAGHGWSYLFGAVIDAATLLALYVILESRRRQAAEASELEQANAALKRAEAAATGLRNELALARADAEKKTGEFELELERLRTQLELALATPEAAPGEVVSMVGRTRAGRSPGAPPGALLAAPGGAPASAVPSAPGSAVDPLVEFAAELARGGLPSARLIAARCRVSQDKARQTIVPQLRAYLASRGVTDPMAVSR